MTRDELLDKLAMELGEWPTTPNQARDVLPDGFYLRDDCVLAPNSSGNRESGFLFDKGNWQARRTQLINKPSWDDAPKWAEWLAQDEDGEWWWMEVKPYTAGDIWTMNNNKLAARHCCGETPAGHNWRDTLERRPEEAYDEARMDAVGQNGATGEHYDCEPSTDVVSGPGKQTRYQDATGDDWIDEFARTATIEEFRGAMRFTIGKYNRRVGKKDEITKEIEKMRDYCERWLAVEAAHNANNQES